MLSYRDGTLYLEEASFQKIAQEFPTPFFIFSEAQLVRNYESLRQGLSRSGLKVNLRYCSKTNSESAVLEILRKLGCEVLVSHLAEAKLVLERGYPPEVVAYQRPFLREDEVRQVLNLGITFIHAACPDDVGILERVASEVGKKIRVSLRVRPASSMSRISLLGILAGRLGLAYSEILRAVELIQRSRWLSLSALNFYIGTLQNSPENYRAMLRLTMALRETIYQQSGMLIEEINCGGGIPSPSLVRRKLLSLGSKRQDWQDFADPSRLSLQAFAERLAKEFQDAARRAGPSPAPTLGIEPGRSLVGDSAVLVTRVCALNRRWVYLDASRNYLPESSFLVRRKICPVIQPGPLPVHLCNIAGGTLNSTDVIMWRIRLPELKPGDLLAILDAGAYTLSRASRYAGLTPAAYLLDKGGNIRAIRREETLSDLTGPMCDQNLKNVSAGGQDA